MPSLNPRSDFYLSQGLKLHFSEWPNRHGADMVLVHGMQDHSRTWDALVERFIADYRVLAPDLRGHGNSAWVKGAAYEMMDYVYDLHQLVLRQSQGPITLIGHSMGGSIAALYAGIFPERVSRLVVIEGIGLWRHFMEDNSTLARIRNWVEHTSMLAARQPKRFASLEDATNRMQQANPGLDEQRVRHLAQQGTLRNEDDTFSWKFDPCTHNFSPWGLTSEEIAEVWQAITAPVLVINAEHGFEHRIGHDNSLQFFADARLQVIPGAGHWTYHDAEEPVEHSIREFLVG